MELPDLLDLLDPQDLLDLLAAPVLMARMVPMAVAAQLDLLAGLFLSMPTGRFSVHWPT
jgi:hypothetical protein